MSEMPTITLAHGDGCAATLRLIRDEILSRFGNPALNTLEDGAWITLNDTAVVVSTDSHVVDPPIFPGGNIGRLAISGTVNDLLASGAIARYLTFSLILTEGFPIPTLEQILDSASETASAIDVQIVAGDTKVVGNEGRSSIYINTTGFGLPLNRGKNYAVSGARAGDVIIITGTVGDHGLAVLSAREGLGFEQRVQTDCAPLTSLLIPVLRHCDNLHSLRDPTRGGLIEALIDMAEGSAVNIIIEQDAIPIKKEVFFGCEMLGLDPLSLANEGKMILAIDPLEAERALSLLHNHPLGGASAVIGRVVPASASQGQLVLKRNGALKAIARPEGNSLPRLC